MKKLFIICIGLCLIYGIAYILSFIIAAPKKMKPFITQLPPFVVIGHQGAPMRHPGNSLESFKETLTINPAAMLEMDVHMTVDGIIVVNHDEDIKSTTNGSGKISGFTVTQLQQFKSGHTVSFDQGKTYPFRDKDYRIPRLDVVLKTFKGVRMSIDIKQHTIECADAVLKCIRDNGATENVIIGSFSNTIMNHVRKNAPEIATAFSQSEVTRFFVLHKLRLTGFFKSHDDAMMIPEFSDGDRPEYLGSDAKQGFRVISHRFIKEAHALNIPVIAWTINKKENMKRLHSWGIRGIVSDYPEILTAVTDKK